MLGNRGKKGEKAENIQTQLDIACVACSLNNALCIINMKL